MNPEEGTKGVKHWSQLKLTIGMYWATKMIVSQSSGNVRHQKESEYWTRKPIQYA